jgi:hypothetical protein
MDYIDKCFSHLSLTRQSGVAKSVAKVISNTMDMVLKSWKENTATEGKQALCLADNESVNGCIRRCLQKSRVV